jgi:hypothetical protein
MQKHIGEKLPDITFLDQSWRETKRLNQTVAYQHQQKNNTIDDDQPLNPFAPSSDSKFVGAISISHKHTHLLVSEKTSVAEIFTRETSAEIEATLQKQSFGLKLDTNTKSSF